MNVSHLNLIFVLWLFAGCQSEPPSGNEILFGDVIGVYEGQCAEYTNSTLNLEKTEEANLTVFAFDLDNAGIKTSCDRIEENEMGVTSADASEIFFKKTTSKNQVSLTYFTATDSIVLTQVPIDTSLNKLIFTGIRQ